ncbi:MAG: F0F1 ATP synthase subunit delta [Albidovulum sp.]
MSEPASISTGIAGRYATAVFELAKEAKGLKALESDIATLHAALDCSADLRGLIASPVVSRKEQAAAIAALAAKMKLSETLRNTLALMAANRRLFVMPQLLSALAGMIADEKGEVTADVTAATTLTKAQSDKLAASLQKAVGKTVKLNTTVDETLIGGLIVKVGSKMIDSSIRSKLASLQNVMKEVG